MSYIFITGGASSGKSKFALEFLKGRNDVSFVATGVNTDPEMAARIREHRKQRPKTWETIEEPVDLIAAVRKMKPGNEGIIIDCLTFWVSNQLLNRNATPEKILERARNLAAFLNGMNKRIIVVTNEVGMGIVPDIAESRAYRKTAGEVNQVFAEMSSEAYIVVSGIGVKIKRG